MRKLNLSKLMDSLYETGEYYAQIEAESTNYEEEYHGTTKDPDGKMRYLIKERSLSLSQTKEVTQFLSKIKPLILSEIYYASSMDIPNNYHLYDVS